MPSHWRVVLEGPATPDIPVEAPHAVLSRWLDTDHKAPVKPFAVDPPRASGRTTTLGVRLLDDSLDKRLRGHTEPGAGVRLGKNHFTVARAPECVARVMWADLEGSRDVRAWEMTFRSPATFRRGNRTSPWPAPEGLVTSLVSRWRRLDAASAPELTAEAARSLWVSDVDGRSEVLQLRNTVVSGFVGRVRYVCDGPESYAVAIAALLSFAPFAGVGSHTAFGLGAVDVSPS